MSSVLRKLAVRLLGDAQERCYSRFQARYDLDLSFTETVSRFPDRNVLYAYMHHYYHHRFPEAARQHRAFFKQEQRGFGEDALHAMWWLLLREFKPVTCLEIGVYRGQVISLWGLVARHIGYPCQVHGISPFTPAGDDVSDYRLDVDYLKDTVEFFQAFELPAPTLVRSLSTMADLPALHLTVLALIHFIETGPGRAHAFFRSAENSSEAIAGNITPIVHTVRCI